jgi:hypothetical protein
LAPVVDEDEEELVAESSSANFKADHGVVFLDEVVRLLAMVVVAPAVDDEKDDDDAGTRIDDGTLVTKKPWTIRLLITSSVQQITTAFLLSRLAILVILMASVVDYNNEKDNNPNKRAIESAICVLDGHFDRRSTIRFET